MKVILDGEQLTSCTFADLKPGDVFTMNGCAYVKTNNGQCFNVHNGQTEPYPCNCPIVYYPNAQLNLTPAP